MRWSEAGYLSQIVLAHALRQASVSLILDVRQKKPMWQTTFETLGKVEIWISVLLAIPVGIAVNLVTPAIQKSWERRSDSYRKVKLETRANKKREQMTALRAQLRQICTYHREPARLNTYILVQLIKLAFISSFATIYVGVLSVLQFIGLGSFLNQLLGLLAQVVILFSAFFIFGLCKRVMENYRRVRNFSRYRAETIALIQALEHQAPAPQVLTAETEATINKK
jgi:hypothetical protein